ncbi:hypothetical protein N9917_04115 [Deltaproteobacteria bacterium]|nr:hypothetical protein [Deltaproteobacteria bacterium]
MEIKIDKNIPVPKKKTGFAASIKTMEVGDSFFIPGDGDLAPLARKISGTAYGCGRDYDMKFSVRQIKPDRSGKSGGVRCWRVK